MFLFHLFQNRNFSVAGISCFHMWCNESGMFMNIQARLMDRKFY